MIEIIAFLKFPKLFSGPPASAGFLKVLSVLQQSSSLGAPSRPPKQATVC